jgi:hypothetical protein
MICLGFLRAEAQHGYAETAGKFFRFYNAQLPDSLYQLYSSDLQKKLPPGKTAAVITGLHVQYGDLSSLQLLKQDSGFNIYKARFVHQTMCLFIELNGDGLLNGYRLVPYQPEYYKEEKNDVK